MEIRRGSIRRALAGDVVLSTADSVQGHFSKGQFMARSTIIRQIGIGFIALVSATMVMGGCSSQKKQTEAALAEAADLREKVATLDQANRDKDGKIAELQTALSTCQTQLAAKPASEPNPAIADGGTSSGGSKDFSKDSDGNMRARLSGDILFDPGQATLKSGAKKTLDRIAAEIKSKYRSSEIRVEGHTDTDPIRKAKGRFTSNEALSEARADAVRKYLVSKGVTASRVEAVGYGATKPKNSKAASRRVEIVILK
ncbi:MAG: OmpA family protein [Phycisphaerae bacterium]|jgi:flagellar motor protein MotB